MQANENTDFFARFCHDCGEPKNELRNNIEVILRCTCDWQREFDSRVKRTIHKDYWGLSITDWSPKIFRQENTGCFKNLIKVQKADAIRNLYNYCFQLLKTDGKFKTYALDRNIGRAHNLYIRGPAGSGRGLLLSCIKTFAAGRGINTTPLPADWSTFKTEISQCNWNGKEAEIAKNNVAEQYKNVPVLILENLKGENSKFPFKGATLIDDLLTKRLMNKGCMIFSSEDFIKQIGDMVSERLPDILISDATKLIIMLSSDEADALLNTLTSRMDNFRNIIEKSDFDSGSTKKGFQNSISEDQITEKIEELLHLENAFKNTPTSPVLEKAGRKFTTGSILEKAASRLDQQQPIVRKIYINFKAEKDTNSLSFREAQKKVFIKLMESCQALGQKMEKKEMIEVCRMMSIACSDPKEVDKYIKDAADLKQRMVSE